MGLISTLLSFVRTTAGDANVSDVKVDSGGGANITAHHYSCPGDDSHPLPGDLVATSSSTGRGAEHVTGYLDSANAGAAAAGEKRLYSRDSDGAVMAVVWLKADGTIELGANPTEFVAVAQKVLDELEAVKADLDAFKSAYDGHIHITTATVQAAVPAVLGTISPTTSTAPDPHTPESVASAVVKLEP